MRMAVLTAMVLLLCVAGVLTAAAATRTHGPGICGELPLSLRSHCTGPRVSCAAHADHTSHFEVVFATEPTLAQAQTWLKLAQSKGFGAVKIEADAKCSNGSGVYEVAKARFLTRTAAQALVKTAKTSGFPNARTEES